MSNETIFWTQIATTISFVFAIFGLYKLLVGQKDATIQLLKETVSNLKDQLAEARSMTPDVLAQQLSNRIKLFEEELARLSQDQCANQYLIHEKTQELHLARQKAEELTKQVSDASEMLNEFLCPKCGAPLLEREYHSELVEYEGREIDVDHDFTVFECGYAVLDGKPNAPCQGNQRHIKSVVIPNQ